MGSLKRQTEFVTLIDMRTCALYAYVSDKNMCPILFDFRTFNDSITTKLKD